MIEISKKYFIKDKKRNTFCIMVFMLLLILSVLSLIMSIYDYELEVSKNSVYYNLSVLEKNKDVLNKDFINIVSSRKDSDDYFYYVIRINPEDEEKLVNYFLDEEVGYGEYDNSDNSMNLIKFRPLVMGVVIICFISVFIMCSVIIYRKFKKEENTRSNLNNIGANRGTLLKLDSVYVWVFIIIYIINIGSVSSCLLLFNMNDYFYSNIGFIFSIIFIIHLVMMLVYYLILYINIWQIKAPR